MSGEKPGRKPTKKFNNDQTAKIPKPKPKESQIEQLGSESHCFEFFGSVQANHSRGFLAHCLTACKTSVNSVGQMGLLAPSSARRGGRGRGK